MWASWPFAMILFATVGSLQTPAFTGDFAASSEATKIRVLSDIATSRSSVGIHEVITLLRAGLRDASPEVRIAALAAVMGRAFASRWAGSSGPAMGPLPEGSPLPPPRRMIPSEWKGDQQTLRETVEESCITLLTTEADDRVRHEALLAVLNLELPARPLDPLPEPIVSLLRDLYRRDPATRIRTEVLKTFRLIPNDSPEIRALLRDALVDSNSSIRFEALAAISPRATMGVSKVSFEEARATLVSALGHADPGVRLGAVQALNVFGAPAVQQLPALERLARSDPDPKVRESARLAVEAIQRALRSPARFPDLAAAETGLASASSGRRVARS